MGLFDRLWLICPGCRKRIEFRSKAGECSLENYSIWDAPLSILADAAEDTDIYCERCGINIQVIVQRIVMVEERIKEESDV